MRGGSKKRVYNSIDSTLIGLNLYVVCLVIIFYVLVFQNQRISIEADALLIDKIDNEPTSIANEPKIQDEITAESSDKAEKPSEPVKDEAIVKFEADVVNEKSDDADFEAVTIEISRSEFSSNQLTIDKGTKLRWLNNDTRIHKIACYEGLNRVYTDKNLDNGEYSEYIFDKTGEYLCIDSIFGIRQNINVV